MRSQCRCYLLAALLCVVGAAAAVAAPPVLPALVDPPGQEHHVGKVVFVELVTPDLAAAKQFYGGLFGWTFRDISLGAIQYAEAWHDGIPVAGLVQRDMPAGERRQPAWLSFVATRDADATAQAAVQHGAKLLFAPHSVPDRGREAVLADPQGAVFAVLASSSGDPPDVLAAPGEWIWSALITSDPDTDAAFYQTLFGYEVYELPGDNTGSDDGALHLMLASDDYARASVNSLPPGRPNNRPHWLDFVRVDDAAKTAARIAALGGRVLVEPRVDRHGGRVAVVADPQGAPFGLMEWPNTETKAVTP